MLDTILDYVVIALPPVLLIAFYIIAERQEAKHRERDARAEKHSTD